MQYKKCFLVKKVAHPFGLPDMVLGFSLEIFSNTHPRHRTPTNSPVSNSGLSFFAPVTRRRGVETPCSSASRVRATPPPRRRPATPPSIRPVASPASPATCAHRHRLQRQQRGSSRSGSGTAAEAEAAAAAAVPPPPITQPC